jgi:hypothetical protein
LMLVRPITVIEGQPVADKSPIAKDTPMRADVHPVLLFRALAYTVKLPALARLP